MDILIFLVVCAIVLFVYYLICANIYKKNYFNFLMPSPYESQQFETFYPGCGVTKNFSTQVFGLGFYIIIMVIGTLLMHFIDSTVTYVIMILISAYALTASVLNMAAFNKRYKTMSETIQDGLKPMKSIYPIRPILIFIVFCTAIYFMKPY